MTPKSPAFQFYPGDFLADANVAVMTTEEVGAYLYLTLFAWGENGLPNDIEELASMAKLPVDRFKVSWEKRIKRCFREREDGRLVHPRLEAERVKQQEFRDRMSEFGKTGGRPRKGTLSGDERVGFSNQKGTGKGRKALLSSISNKDTPIIPTDVDRVLQHYVTLHPRRKVVGGKLSSIVRSGLKHFSAEELIEALDGNAADPWCVSNGKHELGFVLRDADKINEYRAKAGRVSNGTSPKSPDPRDGAW